MLKNQKELVYEPIQMQAEDSATIVQLVLQVIEQFRGVHDSIDLPNIA